jgi:hypothetical protein
VGEFLYSRQYGNKLPSRQKVGGLVATPVKQMKRHLYINNVHFMKSMLTRKIIKGRYAVILKIKSRGLQKKCVHFPRC